MKTVFWRSFVESVLMLSALSLALVLARIVVTGSSRFAFVPWNLALAWIPFILSWLLSNNLQHQPWRHWQNILLSVLWLVFLPNTWYVLTDYIHIHQAIGQVSQLFDIVLITALVTAGFSLGFASLFVMHKLLVRRLTRVQAYVSIELIILLSSFAIYLGRDLRWNTWDVLADPTGLLLDVTDRIVDPFGHPRAISITGLFFVLISVLYAAVWRVSRHAKSPQ